MDYEPLYRRLDILDNKCSALLQLSSVVLALNTIPVSLVDTSGATLVLTAAVALMFLTSSLLALTVIWVDWAPSERTVVFRTRIYVTALAATGLGLVTMTARIVQGLLS